MPSIQPSSQATNPAIEWFGQPLGLQLMQQFQRQAIPEITRVFGHSGLYLSPGNQQPSELSGNMLAQVLSLQREPEGFSGVLRCDSLNLPIASESLSLVYGLCVLETSPDPDALFEDMVRCLKPEGVLVLLGLNGLSPTRLRWHAKGIRPVGKSRLRRLCADHSLEITKLSQVGPIWLRPQEKIPRYRANQGLMNIFYAGHLLVAKRRVAGLTPLRKASQAYKLNPGVGAV
ncbi:MAG TPA: methyltransferase domain-containing protein [Arenimonas sp.]|nr:methyltransferase domain-containing protein [Arenimonas sp.]